MEGAAGKRRRGGWRKGVGRDKMAGRRWRQSKYASKVQRKKMLEERARQAGGKESEERRNPPPKGLVKL